MTATSIASPWSEATSESSASSTQERSLSLQAKSADESGTEVSKISAKRKRNDSDSASKKKDTDAASKKKKTDTGVGSVQDSAPPSDWADHLQPVFDPEDIANPLNCTANPLDSLKKDISLYESFKAVLKREKKVKADYSRQVYVKYLDKLFEYPLTERHSNCISQLKPMYTFCENEKCPTLIFTSQSKEDGAQNSKHQDKRRSVLSKLEEKLKALRDGILQKFSLVFPEMPAQINSREPVYRDAAHPTVFGKPNISTKSKPLDTASIEGIKENSSFSSAKKAVEEEVEKVHDHAPQNAPTALKSYGSQKSMESKHGYSILQARSLERSRASIKLRASWSLKSLSKPRVSSIPESKACDTFDDFGYGLPSAGLESGFTGFNHVEEDKAESSQDLVRRGSVFEPPAQASLFVIPYDLDSTLGGSAIIFDSEMNAH